MEFADYFDTYGDELKPCPFCGGDVVLEHDVESPDGSWWVEAPTIWCATCNRDTQFPEKGIGKDGLGTLFDFFEWWNTRPLEKALKTEIIRLQRIVAEYRAN